MLATFVIDIYVENIVKGGSTMTFVKCKLCDEEIAGEKCVFAQYQRVVDGKEYHFCSERHADEFEKERLRTLKS